MCLRDARIKSGTAVCSGNLYSVDFPLKTCTAGIHPHALSTQAPASYCSCAATMRAWCTARPYQSLEMASQRVSHRQTSEVVSIRGVFCVFLCLYPKELELAETVLSMVAVAKKIQVEISSLR